MANATISRWPEDERPREKLIRKGAETLSDAELLAIFLRTGIPGKNSVELARDLLAHFGGLQPLLRADRNRVCGVKGLGNAKYAQLQAGLEMARRVLFHTARDRHALHRPRDTANYLRAKLSGYGHEVFACLFLDTRHRIIMYEEMFHGTIDRTGVHPREVLKRALHHNAAAVIFAHNHPSGVTEPSRSDEEITRKLQQSLQLVDIRVLDHFIVGDGDCLSFAEQGLL